MLGGITTTLLIGLPPLPAPPPLVKALQKIEIETSTDVASAFRLRFGLTQSPGLDWDLVGPQYEETLFRPFTQVQIRVKVGIEIPETIINGFISGQQVLYDDEGGGSALEVSGMDATMLMNLQEKVMPWPMMPDAQIAQAIFAQYLITPLVSPTLPSLIEPEGTTTQRGTDIRFLRRLAQRNGYECFVQPQPQTGIDLGYFGPATNYPAPAEAVLNVRMGSHTNVSDFKIRYDMLRPTTAVGMGLDVKTRAPSVFPALVPATPPPVAGLYPFGVPMGLDDATIRSFGPRSQPMIFPAETGEFAPPGLASATQAIVNRASWAVVAEGTVGPTVGVLRPGGKVNVRGVGLFFNGSYYVTRVSHIIDCDSYIQKFEARRNAVMMTGTELFVEI
jgi:hypothetical protein